MTEKFKYMFPLTGTERRRAYVFFRGWMPTFALMCKQIDTILSEDKRGFEWIRIREKFGAPSLFYEMRGRARHVIHAHRPDAVTRVVCEPVDSFERSAVEIHEVVLRGELALRESCIVCGSPSIITNAAGPWASLCHEHSTGAFLENSFRGSVWTAAEIRDDCTS
ncbi:hypothetical protein AX767_09560 [Variovorax sp. PAMC 28711]|nr:hypothetical protein AX767_09560 [Variovorax sp. PAMC 28711]